MEELIKYLKDTQLKGIKGMKIEGEIPVSEEQLNVLLEQFVRPRLEPQSDAEGEATSEGAHPAMALLPYLKFPVLQVKVKENKLILKVKVEV